MIAIAGGARLSQHWWRTESAVVRRKQRANQGQSPPARWHSSKPSTLSSSSSLPSIVWNFYCRCLNDRPWLTKATMAAVIFFSSDSATQCIMHRLVEEERKQAQIGPASLTASTPFEWQPDRAISAAGFGVLGTSWLHIWWGWLEAAVGKRLPIAQGYRLANATVKVFLDQSIGAPIYIYSYYVLTNFFQASPSYKTIHDATKSWMDVNTKASEMIWPTLMYHWRLWPFVHMVNFYFVPLHHRVLVQNSILVGWSGYLSYLNHAQQTNVTAVHLEEQQQNKGATIIRRETEHRILEKEIKVALIRRHETELLQKRSTQTKSSTASASSG